MLIIGSMVFSGARCLAGGGPRGVSGAEYNRGRRGSGKLAGQQPVSEGAPVRPELIDIVLVNTSHPGNIGAVARA
ncbi:MAG TPA: hypothetical protein VJ947_08695, partial [Pseudohaliea sp.]|nr:hypothetical protein [Pseudohaliea sp.]